MDKPATHEDANLILRLFELRREEKFRAARDWFARHFGCTTMAEYAALCPPGTDANAYSRMVTSYWDMVASFITSGVLNKELFFKSGQELLFVWTRLRTLLPEIRQAMQSPMYLHNLETVGNEFIDHWERNSPGAYAVFAARINALVAKTQAQG